MVISFHSFELLNSFDLPLPLLLFELFSSSIIPIPSSLPIKFTSLRLRLLFVRIDCIICL
ncbi:hypothetical protein DERP_005179 [Dermatophagoides pteronyssinus]|uniref:Uncharacterized protein n=1 Tax=Dermatophagoides pteronyssinus TaxID=6956 RepID=A0ABQ8JM33_DERPT|nr:hypothetical protein DERP_005179 [Dermatophagoides pteronyssinus]